MKKKNTNPLISVIMGSESDRPVMERCTGILDQLGVPYELRVLSAHRSPRQLATYAQGLEEKGIKVVIAGASGAAHLPGVVAAHTDLPVMGVPLCSSPLHGLDALYSIVQMPSGVPVGCMAVGKAGATNAAVFALRILSIYDNTLKEKLINFKRNYKKKKTHSEGEDNEKD